MTCGEDPREHVVKTTLPVKSVSRYFQSSVNSYTRTDSNTAVVSAWFESPRPAARGLRRLRHAAGHGAAGGGVSDATWSPPGIQRYDA